MPHASTWTIASPGSGAGSSRWTTPTRCGVSIRTAFTSGALRGLRRVGLHHRIAVVGFDDIQLADLLDPPVSVVAQDPPALGRTAARLLLSRLDGDDGPFQHVVVPTRLVARGSGEIRP
ncbi:MAG TPA: substrate-binding domain-containing protein [Candidatus Dormibacteraeota bacterium]|nr:substrate-binding domain-containing protein [Candidatus Dormibacteraeota bacterium]